ncbi:DUF4194 domain-containing protein [Thalassospira lucentensis]|uniref:DUF4194 domain-containing protein n=1 Tax=Thalassospira lucentensis TaxID=168935 RepID=UPI00142D2998|nr:DUF4194 domain-containing protein [Thalassospira lucentensis]NIZ02532.1 DUF4194 domain-containing protein [Thalassospira lucentensis]
MSALIHVKLTGEGDFGPVDLECAIPPARLPVVMAALFGQPLPVGGDRISHNATASSPSPSNAHDMRSKTDARLTGTSVDGADDRAVGGASVGRAGAASPINEDVVADRLGGSAAPGVSHENARSQGGLLAFAPESYGAGGEVMDPGTFLTRFVGTLGDLVARLQPRGFAETILIAAIWLHYRDARNMVTRDDIRRALRRQDHLRMPRNFSRDFHTALSRGYLEMVENEDGYVVSSAGYQWFRSECRK